MGNSLPSRSHQPSVLLCLLSSNTFYKQSPFLSSEIEVPRIISVICKLVTRDSRTAKESPIDHPRCASGTAIAGTSELCCYLVTICMTFLCNDNVSPFLKACLSAVQCLQKRPNFDTLRRLKVDNKTSLRPAKNFLEREM